MINALLNLIFYSTIGLMLYASYKINQKKKLEKEKLLVESYIEDWPHYVNLWTSNEYIKAAKKIASNGICVFLMVAILDKFFNTRTDISLLMKNWDGEDTGVKRNVVLTWIEQYFEVEKISGTVFDASLGINDTPNDNAAPTVEDILEESYENNEFLVVIQNGHIDTVIQATNNHYCVLSGERKINKVDALFDKFYLIKGPKSQDGKNKDDQEFLEDFLEEPK